MVTVASSLQTDFALFSQLSSGTWPFAAATASKWEQDRLGRLVVTLGSESSIPLLMALKSRSERDFRDAVRFLERYVARYNLCGGHKSSLGDALFKQARKVRDSPGWRVADLEVALAPLTARYADDGRFRAALEAVTYSGSASMVRYILTTIDAYYPWYCSSPRPHRPRASSLVVFDLSQGDVDHVYPQSPRPGQGDAHLDADREHLGNLAFLASSDNRAAGNAPFQQKQQSVYATATPLLTRDLADVNRWRQWTHAEYSSRQHLLVDICMEVFRVA
jgi:hypothetical protein